MDSTSFLGFSCPNLLLVFLNYLLFLGTCYTFFRKCSGRGVSGCCLGWSVGSSGFPLRHTHGNPGDRFLPIEISLDQMRAGDRKFEALPNDLRISVWREAYIPTSKKRV